MRREELAELARSTGFPRVTIYIPTHTTYPQVEQDPIRLSNALGEAEERLIDAGVRTSEARSLLAAARGRAEDADFWRHQNRALAVFIEAGETRWVKLPREVPELTLVAERYQVLPLFDAFADRGRFNLLAVTGGGVRLLVGDEHAVGEETVDDLPANIGEANAETDFSDDVSFHARDRGKQVGGAATPRFQARGDSPEDYAEIELEAFVGDVAKAVDRHLGERTVPLVLAAQPRMLGRLREELRYRHIADADIREDPSAMTDDALHAAAWEIAGPILRGERDSARARLQARLQAGDGRGTTDLATLLRATEEGRVEALFVARGGAVWGRYDERERAIDVADAPRPGCEDLLNLLAVKTVVQGGEVFSLPPDLAGRSGPVAGLLRY